MSEDEERAGAALTPLDAAAGGTHAPPGLQARPGTQAPPGGEPVAPLPGAGELDAFDPDDDWRSASSGGPVPFRARVTVAVLVAALAPVAVFAVLLLATQRLTSDAAVEAILLGSLVLAVLLGVGLGAFVTTSLTRPLRDLADALDRIAAGDRPAGVLPVADDELGRLAERQNRLADDLARRDRQLARVVESVATYSPIDGPDRITARVPDDAVAAFGLIDAQLLSGAAALLPMDERVPGEPLPVRAELRAGGDELGVLVGRAPATVRWERFDQNLFELFATVVGASLRAAQLYGRVDAQNTRLRELDAAKDDFLRGIGHNLQTPLARIRAYADQLAVEVADGRDRRAAIIAEQSDRLSRMVRQLLTVSRLDSGVLRPVPEVFAPAGLVRRAWEALGAVGVTFELRDDARGWLAVADPDQVDQVVWALLDNAVRHGGAPVQVTVGIDEAAALVALTIADSGRGVPTEDREMLFGRYARGGAAVADGTGLGLYVARALARANGGDLVLDPTGAARPGAAFTLTLPAESATEG